MIGDDAAIRLTPEDKELQGGGSSVVRTSLLAAATLAGAWAAVGGAHWLDIEWVLPPLVLLGTAGLLRAASSLFGRLVAAAALLVGTATGVGLLLSVWRWGLSPVPVTLLAVSLLWLGYVVTGRRPALPRPSLADLPALGVVVAAWEIARPLLAADGFVGRLSVVIPGEDNARHITGFDAIGRLGGYLFADGNDARAHVIAGMDTYPQGWHFTAALIDRFLRVPGNADGIAVIDHYLLWSVLTEVFLIAAIVRLAQVLGRPSGLIQHVVLTCITIVVALGTEMIRLLMAGYTPEILGLALFVILVAVVIDPTAPRREHLVLAAALLVGIGFTYYLFLVPAGLVVLLWLIVHRKGVLRHPVTLAGTALVAACVAPVNAFLGARAAVDTGALDVPGVGGPVYLTLLVLGPIYLTGLLLASRHRRPHWRMFTSVVLITIAFAVGVAVFTTAGYYYQKLLHVAMALLIAGVGSLVALLPAHFPGRLAWIRHAAAGVAMTAAAVGTVGLTDWGPGVFTDNAIHLNWWQAWSGSFYRSPAQADIVVRANRAFPAREDVPSVVVDTNGIIGYQASVYLSALQRTSRQTQPFVSIPEMQEPQRLQRILSDNEGPVRLIATNQEARLFAAGIVKQDRHPKRVTLVTLPPKTAPAP